MIELFLYTMGVLAMGFLGRFYYCVRSESVDKPTYAKPGDWEKAIKNNKFYESKEQAEFLSVLYEEKLGLCCAEDKKYNTMCGKPATCTIRWLLDLKTGDKWFLVPCCEDHYNKYKKEKK